MPELMQLQWSLNQSFDTSIAVARSILNAATRDNVQPLAILACEKFGATLAICPETSRKMETLVIKVPQPLFLNFVKSSIGFQDDSATQLCQSLAGTQFLGLVAPLIATMGPFEAGSCLEQMLRVSAADRTLMPTARQLRDLLTILEPKLARSGFGDGLIGWSIFLSKSCPVDPAYRGALEDWRSRPSNDGLSRVVDCFRQISRIGDAATITFRADGSIPWLAAFTKWCLGIPPSIFLEDGTSILSQPKSQVTIIVRQANDVQTSKLKISIYRKINGPAELIVSDIVSSAWTRMMVKMETFGQLHLLKNQMLDESSTRLMTQVLPYALKQVVALSRLSPGGKDHPIPDFARDCFAIEQAISETLSRMLSLTEQLALPTLKDGGIFLTDLPRVKIHMRELKQSCGCLGCDPAGSLVHSAESCTVRKWQTHFTAIVMDILALSLFENSESLLVFAGTLPHVSSDFQDKVKVSLWQAKRTSFKVRDVLSRSLALVGHTGSINDVDLERWIMSCCKGQAVYPRLFESREICDSGNLTLSWASGSLRHNNEDYSRVISPGSEDNPMFDTPKPPSGFDIIWQVAPEEGFLAMNLALVAAKDSVLRGALVFDRTGPPFQILNNVAETLFLESCGHSEDNGLLEPDPLCLYIDTISLFSSKSFESKSFESKWRSIVPTSGSVIVITTGGDPRQKMAAQALLWTMDKEGDYSRVMIGHACMQCGLDVCRKYEIRCLIC